MGVNVELVRLVIGLPLAAAVILGLFGGFLSKSLGKRLVGALSVLPLVGSFALSAKLTMDLIALPSDQRSVVDSGIDWISTTLLRVPFEWLIDPLSMTMALIVTGVGSLIFLYSTGYMSEERDYARFFAYLNLFAASMLILVLGNNLALLFMGWEGVGLCSYLLIGFWYKDLANAKAANKAFIVNRIGDWGLTLGIFMIFAVIFSSGRMPTDLRALSYDHVLPELWRILSLNPQYATIIGLLLFVGAAGKSAQFPLYFWLPDAMAGPTPVSALIHAATMVTSGVVLLNRLHVVFELSPVASGIVVAVGAFTALFAAIIAFGQTDIKKVLAFSTVSQLGFMFIACGAGSFWGGMFHVTTHAFFKALLFLGAGAVIHAMSHNQDMRNYGRLSKYLPITTWTMVIGWLAIAAVAIPGVFGFSGWYSKEAIIGAALGGDHAMIEGVNVGVIAGWVGLLVALMTSAYMTRLTVLTFFGKEERWRNLPEVHHHEEEHHEVAQVPVAELGSAEPDPYGFFYTDAVPEAEAAHHDLDPHHTPKEVPPSMWLPLVVLAALSLAGGFFLSQNQLFETWLYPKGLTVLHVHEHPEGLPLEWISLAAALGGIIFGVFVYRGGLPKDQSLDESKWRDLRLLQRDQFGFDRLLTSSAVDGGREAGRGLWILIDNGFVDKIVNGSGWVATQMGRGLQVLQTGLIRTYALAMLLGIVGLLVFFLSGLSGGGR